MGTGTTFVLCASLNLSPVPLLMQDPRTTEAIRAQENFTVENELNGGEVFDFYDTELQVRAIPSRAYSRIHRIFCADHMGR